MIAIIILINKKKLCTKKPLKDESISDIESMNTINDEFYERIKIFSENKQLNFYFDNISNCLKDIYTTTNDPELFEVYSK